MKTLMFISVAALVWIAVQPEAFYVFLLLAMLAAALYGIYSIAAGDFQYSGEDGGNDVQ